MILTPVGRQNGAERRPRRVKASLKGTKSGPREAKKGPKRHQNGENNGSEAKVKMCKKCSIVVKNMGF